MQLNSLYSKELLDNSIAGVFITTLKGDVIYFNNSFARIFQLSNLTQNCDLRSEMFYANVSERQSYIETLTKSGNIKDAVFRGKRLNGEHFYYRINSNLVEDEHKNKLILGSLIDVSHEIYFQNRLNDEKRKYEELIENSVQIIQSFDKNGKILFCNNLWYKKFKFTPEDLENLNLFDVIDESSKEHCQSLFSEIIKGKPVFDIEVTFKSKTGEKMPFKGNVMPLLKDGEFIASHGFFHDLTDLKRADNKAKDQESLLNTILNTIPVCLYLKNHKGEYVFSNKMMQESVGCDMTGKIDREIFHKQNFELLHSTDREAFMNPDRTIQFNFSLESESSINYFYCGKKSHVGIDGNPMIFGYSVDITELTQKAIKIEENEKILNSLVENSNSGFMLINYDAFSNEFLVLYKNDYNWERTGISFDNKTKNFLQNYLDDSSLKKLTDQDAETFSNEFKHTLNGKSNYFTLFIRNIKKSESGQIKIAVIINEITEKKELINTLEQKLKDNSMLVGEVHHRVKNNLAIIDGILELNKYKTQDIRVESFLSDIQSRIKTIAIVHEKLYKSETFSSISIKEYLSEITHHYKKMYEIRNVRSSFYIDVNENISFVLSQAIPFGLLISELISNSLKHGHSGTKNVEIHVKIENNFNTIDLEFFDRGKGLPDNFDINKSTGFGFKLILNLIKQLKAEYKISTKESFKFNLKFKNLYNG